MFDNKFLNKKEVFFNKKLYEVYEDDKNFYLIMDLIKGGELFEVIVKRQRLS